MKKRTPIAEMVAAVLIVLASVFAADGLAWEKKTHVTYVGQLGERIEVSWKAVEGAKYYRVRLVNVDTGEVIKPPPGPGHIGIPTYRIDLDRTGHYFVKIAACDNTVQPHSCSQWAASSDPSFALVDGQPCAWWLDVHEPATAPPAP